MTTTTITNARDLFRTAYENRYTWDEHFPGYTADLELKQGEEVYHAQIEVNSDLTIAVTGIEDEKVQESVYNQMRDIVTHRKRSSFDKAHGKNEFNFGNEDNTGAVEILVTGDAMGSNYKVRGQEICQVSRVMGPIAFTINTNETLDTGKGYIATGYNAVFRNSKTHDLQGKREFKEAYAQFGDYYLPTCQIIEEITPEQGTITTEFRFSNIALG